MAERELFPANNNPKTENETTALTRPHAKPVAKRLETKETTAKKFVKLFLAEDVEDIGEYLVKDLIIPTIKDVFLNFMTAALWGDRRSGNSYRDSSGRRRTDYSSISRSSPRRERDRDREDYSSGRKDFDIDNLMFATREQADLVLTRLEDYIDDYGFVTVGYLLELLGESSAYTSEYYGWRNLDRASVRRVGNAHKLNLPRPVRIEK